MTQFFDARQRALSEIEAARRDVYARLVMQGRAAHLDGWDDPRLMLHEEFRLLAEGAGRAPRGDDFGARFVGSASWEAFRDGNTMGGYAAEQVTVPVMEAHELHTAATLAFPPGRTAVDDNQLLPLLSAVFDMVTVIPSTTTLVRPMGLTATEVVGVGLPDGASSVEVATAAGTDADVTLHRQALHVNVARKVLDDSESARRLINELMGRFFLRAIAHEIIMGDGSTTGTRKQLLGVNSKSGVGSVAVATGDTTTALATAIQTVQAAGYEDGHTLVAAPLDARKFLMHATYLADRVPSLRRIVAFNRLTAGTAFLGAFGAANLHLTPVAITVSQDHSTNWTTGLATVQPEAYAWLDIPNAGAFCKITGV